MDEELPKSSGHWRPRFSLLTSLLLMTIVGMAIVIVQLWREVGPLRAEVLELREQVGVLTIDDPSLIHAIGVPSDVEEVLKWRVFIPNGETAMLRAKCGDVPRTGYPKSEFQHPLAAGEQMITIKAKKTAPKGLSLVAEIKTPQSSSMIAIAFSNDDLSGMFERDGLSSNTAVMNESGKLVLARTRFAPPGQSQLIAEDAPLPGFIIWLEQK